MAEITVPPDNITPLRKSEPQCIERKTGLTHCWHSMGAGFQNGPSTVVFNAYCCFCAPDYFRQTVYVPWNTPVEEATALQVAHGRLVRVEISPKPSRNPALLVPSNDKRIH